MAISEDDVREIFRGPEHGDGGGLFDNVDDNVDWIVEGTHPPAGHYRSKHDVISAPFAMLAKVQPHGARLIVEHVLVDDDEAMVEFRSLAAANNGFRFDNHYCWVANLAVSYSSL